MLKASRAWLERVHFGPLKFTPGAGRIEQYVEKSEVRK